MLFQRVKNFLRIAVFIAAVEGKVDDFLTGIAQIIRIVICQVGLGGVAHRGLPLGGEGEPPVPRRGGDGGGRGGGNHLLPGPPEGQGGSGGQQDRRQQGKDQNLFFISRRHGVFLLFGSIFVILPGRGSFMR